MSAGGLNLERILVAFQWVGSVTGNGPLLLVGAEQSLLYELNPQAALTVRTLGAIRSCGSSCVGWEQNPFTTIKSSMKGV